MVMKTKMPFLKIDPESDILDFFDEEHLQGLLDKLAMAIHMPCCLIYSNVNKKPLISYQYTSESFRNTAKTLCIDTNQAVQSCARKHFDDMKGSAKVHTFGLEISQQKIIWLYPLIYFGNLIGYLVTGGLKTEVPFNIMGDEEKRRWNVKESHHIHPPFPNQLMVEDELPFKRPPKIAKLIEYTGEEIVDHYHQSKANKFLSSMLKIMYESLPESPQYQNAGNIFYENIKWLRKRFQHTATELNAHLRTDHCGIFIFIPRRLSLILLGSSIKGIKERYPVFKTDNNHEIVADFLEYCEDREEKKFDELEIHINKKVHLSEDGLESYKKHKIEVEHGMFSPIVVQNRCIGICRILTDKKKITFSNSHKNYLKTITSKFVKIFETIISYYRESVVANFILALPPYFNKERDLHEAKNPLYMLANGARQLVNCRSIVIRLKDKGSTGRFLIVGKTKQSVQQHNIFGEKILPVVTNSKQPWCKFNIHDMQLSEKQIRCYTNANIGHILVIPLVGENRELIGFLNCFQCRYFEFTSSDIQGLGEFAKHLETWIKSQQLHWSLQNKKEQIENEKRQAIKRIKVYQELTKSISEANTIAEVFDKTIEFVEQFQEFDQLILWRCDKLPYYPFMAELVDQKEIDKSKVAHKIQRALDYWKTIDSKNYKKLENWLSEITIPINNDLYTVSQLIEKILKEEPHPINRLFPSKECGEIKTLIEKGQNSGELLEYTFFKPVRSFRVDSNADFLKPFIEWELDGFSRNISQFQNIPLEKDGQIFGVCSFPQVRSSEQDREGIQKFLGETIANRLDQIWKQEIETHSSMLIEQIDTSDKQKETLNKAAAIIKKALNADAVVISTFELDKFDYLKNQGSAGFQHDISKVLYTKESTSRHVVETKTPVRVKNIRLHPYCHMSYLEDLEDSAEDKQALQWQTISSNKPQFQEWCGVPIIDHNKKAFGLLKCLNKNTNNESQLPHFSLQDQCLMEAFAEQLSQMLATFSLLKDREQLIAKVAHNCKAPLGVIRGWVQNLEWELRENQKSTLKKDRWDELKLSFREIDNSIELADSFVKTAVLGVRAVHSNLEEGKKTEIDLNRLMWSLKNIWRGYTSLYSKEIFIENSVKYLDRFYGEYDKIQLLFANLIDNATKYSYANKIIRIEGEELDDKYIIKIENFGQRAYLEWEEPESLFRPYTRSLSKDPKRGIFGAGIGLPLCHEIVRSYNGTLSIETKPVEGANKETGERYKTTVTVVLPLDELSEHLNGNNSDDKDEETDSMVTHNID